jgi:hypothetical protein
MDFKPLSVDYDMSTDTLTIDGRKYSGEYFRFFQPQNAKKDGKLFETFLTESGSVAIRQFYFEGLLRWIVATWLKK